MELAGEADVLALALDTDHLAESVTFATSVFQSMTHF
jgi:hypothetical protein